MITFLWNFPVRLVSFLTEVLEHIIWSCWLFLQYVLDWFLNGALSNFRNQFCLLHSDPSCINYLNSYNQRYLFRIIACISEFSLLFRQLFSRIITQHQAKIMINHLIASTESRKSRQIITLYYPIYSLQYLNDHSILGKIFCDFVILYK